MGVDVVDDELSYLFFLFRSECSCFAGCTEYTEIIYEAGSLCVQKPCKSFVIHLAICIKRRNKRCSESFNHCF